MQTRKRTAALAAAAAVAVVSLAACSSASTADPTASPVASASAPTPSSLAPTDAARGEVPDGYHSVDNGNARVPDRAGDGCEGLPGLEPRSDDSREGIGGYWYSELRDIGPIGHATGEVTQREDGQPAAYVAAEGDTMYAIAQRFCIDYPGYLAQLNGIRRGDGHAGLFVWQQDLWAGDTINLDPYTIATVGSQNGQVFEHAIDYRIPEQRP